MCLAQGPSILKFEATERSLFFSIQISKENQHSPSFLVDLGTQFFQGILTKLRDLYFFPQVSQRAGAEDRGKRLTWGKQMRPISIRTNVLE